MPPTHFVLQVIDTVTPSTLPEPDVFISTTGNDSTGDGSKGNPYLTPKFGIQRAFAGQTVGLEAGTYSTNTNTINARDNVTIRPVEGAAVIIVADNTIASQGMFLIDGANVTIDGTGGANGYMTFRGGGVYTVAFGETNTGPSIGSAAGGTLRGVYFDQTGADRLQGDDNCAVIWIGASTGQILVDNCFIHGGDFTSSNKANNHGIVMFGSASTDVTIQNISIIDPSGNLGNAIRDKHGNASATSSSRIIQDCYIDEQGSGQTHQQACIMINSSYTVRRNWMERAGGSGYGLWVREGSGGFCTPTPSTVLVNNNEWNGAQASRGVNDFVDGVCGGSPSPYDEYFTTDGSNAFGSLEAGTGVVGGAIATGASFEPGITGRS